MRSQIPLAGRPARRPVRRPANALALAALTALFAAAGPALADDTEQARILFERGVADLEARLFEKACPAIQQSLRLDPRPGTLFALADCEAQRGRIATAVARYTEYLADYRNFTPKKRLEQRERAGACTAQIAALVPLVPALTLRLPEGAPEEIVVKRDGEVVPAPSIGTALSMDPGEHVITTQVPGGPLVEHPIELQKGEKKELQLIVKLTADPPSDPIPPPASAAPPPILRPAPHLPGLSKPPAPEPPPDPRPFRIGAVAAGSLGLAGIVVGSVAGALALDKKRAVDTDCTRAVSGFDCTSPAGVTAGERLQELGAASTAGFVIGLAGLGAAGVLLLVMPARSSSARPPAPSLGVSVTPGAAFLQGAF